MNNCTTIEIEYPDGSTMGAFMLNGSIKYKDLRKFSNIEFIDCDGDYIFDTHNNLIRLRIEYLGDDFP